MDTFLHTKVYHVEVFFETKIILQAEYLFALPHVRVSLSPFRVRIPKDLEDTNMFVLMSGKLNFICKWLMNSTLNACWVCQFCIVNFWICSLRPHELVAASGIAQDGWAALPACLSWEESVFPQLYSSPFPLCCCGLTFPGAEFPTWQTPLLGREVFLLSEWMESGCQSQK